MYRKWCLFLFVAALAVVPLTFGNPVDDAFLVLDVAQLTAGVDEFTRVTVPGGLTRFGIFGVPVAGGVDVDGDGFADSAFAHMLASPMNRFLAGEVRLVFGDGTLNRAIDTTGPEPRVLTILGATQFENTGSEVWIGDVTGDGLGEVLVSRQGFSPDGRVGAGALTILPGGPALRNLATSLADLDLAAPPPGLEGLTLLGPTEFARLGIWARFGDVDGDGINDLVVAADQESEGGETHRGALYVIRGGSHLGTPGTIDLADFGSTSLVGKIARVTPPTGSDEYHFGSTNQLGDLDGNGRAEILASAALNRGGAVLGPPSGFSGHATAGAPGGAAFILWDDLFPPAPWPAGFEIDLDSPGGTVTVITGGTRNESFGEELLAGADYDGDGHADLFVGDLTGDPDPGRVNAGLGYAIFRAESIKGLTFNIDAPPPGLKVTTIEGPLSGAIGSDTAAQGDFDGDGFDDLMVGNPHDEPLGRLSAGTLHVFFGRPGGWPELFDTQPGGLPPKKLVRITELRGANGRTSPFDQGDTLCYSAAAGDMDGDGRTDLITNEMVGNGVGPAAVDTGNLVIFDGELLSPPRFGLGGGAPSP